MKMKELTIPPVVLDKGANLRSHSIPGSYALDLTALQRVKDVVIEKEVIRMGQSTTLELHQAQLSEARELMELYDVVYEGSYPYDEVRDLNWISEQMQVPENVQLTVVDRQTGRVAGASLFQLDLGQRTVYARGIMIHPDFAGYGCGSFLLGHAYQALIHDLNNWVHIYYTENRTAHIKSQKLGENAGMKPLGLLINKDLFFHERETDVLMGLFSRPVFEQRRKFPQVIEPYFPIWEVIRKFYHLEHVDPINRVALEDPVKLNRPLNCHFGRHGYLHVTIPGMTARSYLKFKVNKTTKAAEETKFQVSSPGEFRALLESALNFLKKEGIEYFEVYVPAWHPEYQVAAHELGLVASGYFPGYRLANGERIDHLVLTWYSPDHDMDLSRCCLTRYGKRLMAVIKDQLGLE